MGHRLAKRICSFSKFGAMTNLFSQTKNLHATVNTFPSLPNLKYLFAFSFAIL